MSWKALLTGTPWALCSGLASSLNLPKSRPQYEGKLESPTTNRAFPQICKDALEAGAQPPPFHSMIRGQ
jgi:hypothetical protein